MENDAVVRELQVSVMRLSEELTRARTELDMHKRLIDRMYSASLYYIAGGEGSRDEWLAVEELYREIMNG